MTIQIGSTSFIYDISNAPSAATAEKAQELLDQFLADLEADKFDQTDDSFDGYENYLRNVIRNGGIHPAFPTYPKFKVTS